MAVLQVVERPSADGASTRVEAVPNPEQTSSAEFKSGEAWPLLTGAQDIVLIASAFAAEGFDVRSITLVDRFFRPADADDVHAVSDVVSRHIRLGEVESAIAMSRSADLFVEQVRLFKPSSNTSVDIRQNGVILVRNVDRGFVDKVLSRAFVAQ